MSSFLKISFTYGAFIETDAMEANSVYLDGACRGPHINNEKRSFSFDHHAGCLRFATLSTCEQVLLALDLGLDPSGLTIHLNDLDADGSLSLWLLMNPDKIDDRVREQVRLIGFVDSHGPVETCSVGGGRAATKLHKSLSRNPGVAQEEAMVWEDQAKIDTWYQGGDEALPEPFSFPPVPVGMGITASGNFERLEGPIEDFADAYARGLVAAILAIPGPEGTTGWTIGKKSDFVPYDIQAFLARANEIEPGWGGGSTIGGAPRNEDGTRSRLTFEEVRIRFLV